MIKFLKILGKLAPHTLQLLAASKDAAAYGRANASNKKFHKLHHPEKYGIKRERN